MESPMLPQSNQSYQASITNEMSTSTSTNIGKLRYYRNRNHEPSSDNETTDKYFLKKPSMKPHHKSTGNLNEYDIKRDSNMVQSSVSNVDFTKNRVKKFDTLQIPIVGYEVMEERARFTIFKLKVEDDKSDQSWLVFRRYTDFVRLFSRLKTEKPDLMLPLPGKRWFRDNFETAFLEDRVRGLQIFINAVLKFLPNHPVVRDFFCLDEPPQVFSYQPEVQAVYGALEESISSLKIKLKQKDATIVHLQNKLEQLERKAANCSRCSTNQL